MDVAEPTITCPYNKAHSIISSRMQFHLTKCRAQYPNAEKTVCPFNSTHVINKVELEFHQQICPDRIVLDSFTCKVGSSIAPKVQLSKVESIEITGEECWDEPIVGSVLERVHEVSKTKPTLQALIGAPKSERKAFRNQERLRIQRVLDSYDRNDENHKEPRKKKEPSSYTKESDIDDEIRYNSSHTYNNGRSTTDNQQRSYTTRDPKNPWGSNKAPPKNGYDETNLQQMQNIKKTTMEMKNDAALSVTKSLGNLKIQPIVPSKVDRDPGNPWGFANKASTFNSSADQNDFPMLPVASRGRGRDRASGIRLK